MADEAKLRQRLKETIDRSFKEVDGLKPEEAARVLAATIDDWVIDNFEDLIKLPDGLEHPGNV